MGATCGCPTVEGRPERLHPADTSAGFSSWPCEAIGASGLDEPQARHGELSLALQAENEGAKPGGAGKAERRRGSVKRAHLLSIGTGLWGRLLISTTLAFASREGVAQVEFVVTTLAGDASREGGHEDGVGSAARFRAPVGVGVDATGNVFVADHYNQTLRKVTPSGVVTTIAGSPLDPGDVTGSGSAVRLSYPSGLAVNENGLIYFSSGSNPRSPGISSYPSHTIRVATPGGSVWRVAGMPGQPGSADGTGTAARFNFPGGIAIDPQSSSLFIADERNHTLREIRTRPDGQEEVRTYAGSAGVEGSTDGALMAARFRYPWGVAAGLSGNIYISDRGNHTIRLIDPWDRVTTVAGVAGSPGSTDGSGTYARFDSPTGLAVDDAGNLYIADTGNHTIRVKDPAGNVKTVAGKAGNLGSVDGPGSEARFRWPVGLTLGANGEIFVSDSVTIRKITPQYFGGWTIVRNEPYAGQRGWVEILDPNWWHGPAPGGRKGFLVLHPVSETESALIRWRGRVATDRLVVTVAGRYGDFVLRCSVNGELIYEKVVDSAQWYELPIDVSRWEGKDVTIDIENQAGGAEKWYFENCAIDDIAFKSADDYVSRSYVLPSSSFRTGANGAEYRTDVRLLNQNGVEITVDATFYDQVTGTLSQVKGIRIEGRSQAAFDNILQSLFGKTLSEGAYGPIRFESSGPILVAASVNNVNACRTGAVSGQWLPGIDVSQALKSGVIGQLAVSYNPGTGYRTNLVFANPGSSPATVTVEIRTGLGGLLARRPIGPLSGKGFAQVPLDGENFGPGIGGTTDANLWLEFTSDQPVLAYATIIHNGSGDPFAVVASSPALAVDREYVLPSSAYRLGANAAEYRTDVRILNLGSGLRGLRAVLYDQATHTELWSNAIQIAGPLQLGIDNIVQQLFGRTLADGAYGPIRFLTDGPLLIAASVNNVNACGTGMVSGQWLPAMAAGAASQALTAGVIGQLAVSTNGSTGYRTNLVFMNPGSVAATATVVVRRGSGGAIGTKTIGPLAANGFTQVALDEFPGVAVSTDTNLWLEFSSDRPVFAYATIIHNGSGDPFAVMATSDTPTAGAPVAAFTFAPTNPTAGEVVTFSNQSTGATSYAWSFGDGTTSTATSPSKTYGAAGNYVVNLRAFNTYGSHDVSKTIAVSPPSGSPPTASFTFSPANPTTGQVVSFRNESTGATSYLWNFGDGTTSTATNPTKTYSSARAYTVSLTATNTYGSSSVSNSLTVHDPVTTRSMWIDVANDLVWDVEVSFDGVSVGTVTAGQIQGAELRTTNTTARVDVATVAARYSDGSPIPGAGRLQMYWSSVPVVDGGRVTLQTAVTFDDGSFYYAPLVSNYSGVSVQTVVNYRLADQFVCPCSQPTNTTSVYVGYYRLWSNSTVAAFRAGGYPSGSYSYWSDLTRYWNRTSGAILLTLSQPPLRTEGEGGAEAMLGEPGAATRKVAGSDRAGQDRLRPDGASVVVQDSSGIEAGSGMCGVVRRAAPEPEVGLTVGPPR
ncbi:MAG: PKD domain-containing protein [Acidobacteria bacterium]|nr:MAG: PKD domain-containing protein [Acidobacteriota bacterium]MCE7884485.1 PKD domain-containing protein [Actinobacteria bacterium ATB1]